MKKNSGIVILVSTDLSNDQRVQRISTTLSDQYSVSVYGRIKKNSKDYANERFKVHRVKTLLESGPFFYFLLNWRFFWHLIFKKFDAIIANDLDTLPSAWVLSKLKNKILVFDAHEYFEEVPELQGKPRKKAIWTSIARKMTKQARLCYTVSQTLALKLEKTYGAEFEVIRNVPFLDKAGDNPKNEKFCLIYQGALNKGRGCEEVILAMKLLVDCELWMVGDGDLREVLHELVHEQELEDQVKFLGMMSPEELQLLTPLAHIGLNLLANSSLNYKYSLANKFFDYMHAGIPSINMSFPEYVSINDQINVAALIDELNIDTIANTVRALRSDKKNYDQLCLNAREGAEQYNWQKEEKKLISLFHNL